MQHVLDAVHLGDGGRLALEFLDHLGRLRLTTEPNDAVDAVHVDMALRDVVVAEDDRLDLVGNGDIVEVLRRAAAGSFGRVAAGSFGRVAAGCLERLGVVLRGRRGAAVDFRGSGGMDCSPWATMWSPMSTTVRSGMSAYLRAVLIGSIQVPYPCTRRANVSLLSPPSSA
jgi:hypothetical protein